MVAIKKLQWFLLREWFLCRTLCNSGIFKTLVFSQPEAYSEPCYIFRILAYSELEAYLEPCQRSTKERFAKWLAAIIIFAVSSNWH